MDIDQLLLDSHTQSLPLKESIGSIATALAEQTIIVPTEGPVPVPPARVLLRMGADVHGRLWVYAYTCQERFAEALPAGSTYATIEFPALFGMVDADPKFAGILLNSGSVAAYPIMRVMFDDVRRVTRRPADERE